jgi:dTDP-4-amino-4,6-dideoxygalactose transaminase
MKAPIPMVDTVAEYRAFKPEIDAAFARVMESGRFVLGPEGEAFERELAAYTGANHAVGVNSGTDALHLALVAAGVGPGDEVIIPSFTFFATGEAVSYTGATPVFADVDGRTFNLDVSSLQKKIGKKTRAVIVVHLFGQCADLEAIARICKEKKLFLIEDCAQSLGAGYRGMKAGAWGDFGCFSFYPTKNLAAAGDAGLVTAKQKKHDEILRMLRHHGSRKTYLHERVGWNSRLDELQAALLRIKLRRLDELNAARRRVAARYREKLAGTKLTLPAEDKRGTHVYHQFTIQIARRDAIREALAKDGIASSIFYPMPLHKQPAYARKVSLPVSEKVAKAVLSLPIHPYLESAAVDRVCEALRAAA